MATTKDELWSLGQRSRGLTEFLSELRALWNDSAAHEISTRYLVPRSDDDQRMQGALAEQQSALEELQGHVATVMELASAAEKLSQDIAQLLRETLQEVSTANGYYQSFSEFNNTALNLFPQIQELINDANSACQGIAADGGGSSGDGSNGGSSGSGSKITYEVPGGGLAAHEGSAKGHTIEKHVEKSEAQLRERLDEEPHIPMASTYSNLSTAEQSIGRAIELRNNTIQDWLQNRKNEPRITLKVTAEPSVSIGSVLMRGDTATKEPNITVTVLVRDNSKLGWYIKTSYPSIGEPDE